MGLWFTNGTFADFAADNLTPADGMQLGFYDGDLLFEGTVRFDPEHQKWKVDVDENTFREYQADSI
jgi:hypothetical protein